jgi:hypothetical protein
LCSPDKDAVLIFGAYFSNGLGILRPTAGLHQSENSTWSAQDHTPRDPGVAPVV